MAPDPTIQVTLTVAQATALYKVALDHVCSNFHSPPELAQANDEIEAALDASGLIWDFYTFEKATGLKD